MQSIHRPSARAQVACVFSLILGAIGAACSDKSTLVAPVAIALVPPADTLTKIGDTLLLTVIVGGHKAGPFEPISWTTLNGGVATVDSLGVVRAVAPGTAPIVATVSGQADTALIWVGPPGLTLTTLTIAPASVTLTPAGTSQFSVSGTWSDGSTSVPAVTYAATGGTISADGLYTAGPTTGTFPVVATQQAGTKADTALVTVSAAGGLVVNAGADQTIVRNAVATMNAAVTSPGPVKMFWTKISGPGQVKMASEQFNSTFDDLTLTDWIGGNQTTVRTTDAPYPDEVGIQGVAGNWYTTFAPPTTDRPRTGTHSWKAFTPYDSNHSAKLLKWNLDDTQAYFSVWVYWPSSEVVSGHGAGGFVDYLNLMQWKERSSPFNPTWVIAVTGLSPGVDQFSIHDWYNSQPIVHTGVPVPKDQWFNLTAYMQEGFGTSGELTLWLNHALLYHQGGINTLGAATNTTAHLMWGIGNYSNALVGQGEQSIYFADAIVTPAADVTKTTATFAAPGTYVLRLTASDGTTTKSDDVTITVQ